MSLFSRIKNRLMPPSYPPVFDRTIDRILGEVGKKSREILETVPSENRKRVLWLTGYYQSKFVALNEAITICALQMRGVEVFPVRYSYFFQDEDVIFGGVFNTNRFSLQHALASDEGKLLSVLLQTKPVFIEAFLSDAERKEAHELALTANPADWKTLNYEGQPFGEYSAYATINMDADPLAMQTSEGQAHFKKHLENCYKLYFASRALFQTIRPHGIVSSHPNYYQWRIPCQYALEHGKSFFSCVAAEKKNSVIWNRNSFTYAESSSAWQSFLASDALATHQELISSAIENRKKGKISASDYAPSAYKNSSRLNMILEKAKSYQKCILFPSNVIVDSAVFQYTDSFNSINEMIISVIDWFSKNPEYLLILKAHPGEQNFLRAGYKNCQLRQFLEQEKFEFPQNVLFIDYNEDISVYSLFDNICGVIAYTSSVCFDAAFAGIRSISACKSHYSCGEYCSVPKDKEDFFKLLRELVSNNGYDRRKIIREAHAYYLLFHFFGSINYGLFSGYECDGFIPLEIFFDSYKALMPGANKALDYVCDSIITDRPIFGENRWPPMTQ